MYSAIWPYPGPMGGRLYNKAASSFLLIGLCFNFLCKAVVAYARLRACPGSIMALTTFQRLAIRFARWTITTATRPVSTANTA